MEPYQRILDDHIEDSKERSQRLDEKVDLIMNNHIAHLSSDISDLKTDIAELRSDLRWLKLIGGFVIVESLAVLGGITSILIKLYVK